MLDAKTAEYISSLPEIDTSRFPKGTLFFAEGRIFRVTETGSGGFHKAREWRQSEETEVALIPGSFPSRHLPLIRRGRMLPVYRSRIELTENDRATCFVFPTEDMALDAAYLDVALIQSTGAYVRNQGHEPAFAVTDGVHVFRLYYYRESIHGRLTDLSNLHKHALPFKPQSYMQGPDYWRLLPSWTEMTGSTEMTQARMPAVKLPPMGDEPIPNSPIQPGQ